jgi:dihydropteroate synthase
MHIKGTPQTMQQHAQYEDVTKEVLDYFIQKIAECHKAGIADLIIDPGFGFAKTATHNFELFRNLSMLITPGKPVLIGISRKSFIYKTLGISATESLNATTALHMAGLLKGASILRVHDVKEAAETVQLFMHCL